MRTAIAILAVALAAIPTAASSAKYAPGHYAKAIHGASYYAPGHEKKRLHLQSAGSLGSSGKSVDRWEELLRPRDESDAMVGAIHIAASMYAKAHDVKLSNVSFEDICKFMDGLDEVDAEELEMQA